MKNETNDAAAKKQTALPIRFIWISCAVVVVLGLVFAGFLALCSAIGSAVRNISAEALQERSGDRVLALMTYVGSNKHSLRERNHAVWALGQLGDRRALEVLEKYYTGGPCDHKHALCQKELQKAIDLCKGGTNISAYFWRTGQ